MTQARKQKMIVLALIALITAISFIALGISNATVPFGRILPVLFGDHSPKEKLVIWDFRLPRIVITVLAGMALALAGSILQSITRNDLADPGIIGINSGAGVAVDQDASILV